jgi:hypothetical protein
LLAATAESVGTFQVVIISLFYFFTTSKFSKVFLIIFHRLFDKFEKGKLEWISVNKSKFEPIYTKSGSYLMVL